MARWWDGYSDERFWIEVTGRSDIGADLRAPQTDDSGKENWRYTLLKEVKSGDIVLHYHRNSNAIIGYSEVAGAWTEAPIVWAARGTYAREKHTTAYERPGLRVPLAGFQQFSPPITLEQLRAAEADLKTVEQELRVKHGRQPLYLPFETSGKRPLRTIQGYIFKFPKGAIEVLPQLRSTFQRYGDEVAAAAAAEMSRSRAPGQGWGSSAARNKVIEVHAMQLVTDYFVASGFAVQDVSKEKPYDLVVTNDDVVLAVEVKGTSSLGESVFLTRNEVAHALANPATAVLAVVSGITVVGSDELVATGGSLKVYRPWQIDSASLQPIAFSYSVPPTFE